MLGASIFLLPEEMRFMLIVSSGNELYKGYYIRIKRMHHLTGCKFNFVKRIDTNL